MAAKRFEEFWEAWPANGSKGFEDYTRRKDRRKCEEIWEKHKLDERAAEIIHDVEQRKKFDKGWRGNNGAFLSAPLVYLRNERWADGGFADVRDEWKRKREKGSSEPRKPEDDGPDLSRWGRAANKILMRLAYMDERRGFVPLGDERLAECLRAKGEIVAMAEADARSGNRWTDEEFISVVRASLEKAIYGDRPDI